jgi:tetratricopeptide (TPR) repeat protein
LLYRRGTDNINRALSLFNEATGRDKQFARAYAESVIACYFLDAFQAEKKYTAEIATNSDKAILYDPKSAECLVAKAIFYLHKKEYDRAVPYLEKALEYNPNSPLVITFLSDFYAQYLPNTSKYLEYSLMGVRLNIGAEDSVNGSYTYLRLANALIQTGFVDESLKYLDKSLDLNPNNAFTPYVRAFVLYAKDGNLPRTKFLLEKEYHKDSNRFDILQDIGKVCYYLEEFDSSYWYYKKFISYRTRHKLDVYKHENLLISRVLEKAGDKKLAQGITATSATPFTCMNISGCLPKKKIINIGLFYFLRKTLTLSLT